jgi:Ser/Thr protein kinase RdoA (MazF antagonist)
VASLTRELAHSSGTAPRLAEQWGRLAAWRRLAKDTPADLDEWARRHLDQLVERQAWAVELVDGDSLVHTDLHSLNILVDEARAQIVA